MNILIIVLIGLSLILLFSMGSQDETVATVVGSGSLSLKKAMFLGGILSFVGILLLSSRVSETVGSNLLGNAVTYTSLMILAVILSTAVWLLLGARTGIPVSTTHTVVGAIVGVGLVWALTTPGASVIAAFNWATFEYIFLGWVVSPLLGFVGAIAAQYGINRVLHRHNRGLLQVERAEKTFRNVIIITACINQASRAANDAGKGIGIFYGLVETGEVSTNVAAMFIWMAACIYSIGLIIAARGVIETVGSSTGQLRPSEAVAVEGSSAVIILVSTLLGLPVSGAHVLLFALMGSARMKGEKPDPKSFRRMVISWLLTFPLAAGLAALFFGLFLLI